MNKGTEEKKHAKTIYKLQDISSVLQIICSCFMIFFGLMLLFLMAVYGFGNSDVTYYTPWVLALTVCGVSFAIALIVLTRKLSRSANTGKSTGISIAIIILNSVFTLLWVGAVASEYRGYVSIWPFVEYCLPLIPLIVIIVLTSISLFLKRLN